jgi:hypothetical protein
VDELAEAPRKLRVWVEDSLVRWEWGELHNHRR